MDHSYRAFLPGNDHPLRLCEGKKRYQILTERHIQALWLEQKYFKNLTSHDGVPIKVVSPGLWNLLPGPDFLKAHLIVGECHLFGDVEIHLDQDSWYQHRHHLDANYDGVVLHIAFWRSKKNTQITSASGKAVLRVCLQEFLTIPPYRLSQLIDLDHYPYRKFVGSGRCAQQLFKSLSEKEVSSFFYSAALWRLTQKSSYLRLRTKSLPGHIVSAGIAMALGFKNNSERFLDLYLEAQSRQWGSEKQLIAFLLGRSGFFSSEWEKKWGESSLYRELSEYYASLDVEMKIVPSDLSQTRPLNHPVRRLVYMAKMIGDSSIKELESKLHSEWHHLWSSCHRKGQWHAFFKALDNLIPNYRDSFWNYNYFFDKSRQEQFLTLLGGSTRSEIVINIFLPLLAEKILDKNHSTELDALQSCYRHLRATPSGKGRYLAHRYFGESSKGDLLKRAYAQQGAFQLHHDFCIHYEASCEGCPFVSRYKKWQSEKNCNEKS